MEPVDKVISIVTPLLHSNVDTDAIMPKQYLKSTKKQGYGDYLFDEWRYLDSAEWGDDCSKRPKNKDFILNDYSFKDSQIMLVKENFGCGSSREHAVWGLKDFGFKVIIGLSFASIFYNNAIRNGLLLITVRQSDIENILLELNNYPLEKMVVSLSEQKINLGNLSISFDIGIDEKNRLLKGMDDIDITSKFFNDIESYESKRKLQEPWIFDDI